MFNIKSIIISVTAGLLFFSCASKQKFEPVKNNYMKKLQAKKKKYNKKGIPAEIALGESLDLQTAINKAELEARARIARSVESKTSSLQKKFQDEAGDEFLDHFSQATKNITDRVLRGSTLMDSPFERNKEGVYRVYGLMVLDYDIYAKTLEDEIAANKAMKARWLASKAYKDLNEEVKEYNEWKKSQSPLTNPQGS